MIWLEENKEYTINTLDELFNCPINMIEECLACIKDTFHQRVEKIERNKGIVVKNSYIKLVNDGINEITVDIKEIIK